MPDLAEWPDALVLARAALLYLCPNIAQATPADPQGTLSWVPFIRLAVTGGADDRVTDETTVQADCFEKTQGGASALAGLVRQRILGAPIAVPGIGVIDFGATLSKPQNIPQDATGLFMYAATYSIAARRS